MVFKWRWRCIKKNIKSKESKSSTGLDENIAAFLCYTFLWLGGIAFALIEKDNLRVRFHAIQSILTFGSLSIVGLSLSIYSDAMPFFLNAVINLVYALVWIISTLLWLYLMISAYKGKITRLPLFGDIAAKILIR